ncbi:COG1361 S-layer family protein [Halopiger goleimassiliensis]|uniref:COG1361 S-layer family protein n=1 Tax=Halopiger goleimassiliensis TaxID=1293048 RepID=UPI000677672B|nr:COG1361 S-layer family protein [Halopiger goleimassiliensis]
MRRIQLVALVFVVLLAGSPLLVSASDEPDFDVYAPENIVEPGEETDLELEIRNGASPYEDDSDVGEAPSTEARDVTIQLHEDGAPVDVKTNETALPEMSAQTLLSETFTVAVDENATAGVYDLEAEIEYTHDDDSTSTDTETVELIVAEQARFETGDVASDLVVGDRGTVAVELTNTGVENASDAVVQFDSPDENLATITPTTDESELTSGSEAFVGDWEINETVTVEAGMELADDAVARTYPVTMTVQFRDGEGVDRTSRELRVGAESVHEQSFDVKSVTTDLYVGEDGTVSGELVNHGPKPIENGVLVLEDGDGIDLSVNPDERLGAASNVYPRETQYAVGDLEPGESAPFEFRIGVGGEAEPGPRILEADVRYRNAHGDVRMTNDPVDLTLDVAPERDEFAVEVLEPTQEAGETRTVDLEITNQKDETLTDIEPKLFTNEPLDGGDDDPFVPELGPGESATISFEVSVADGATPQTYRLQLDFRYDDERSNSQLTDTYRVPIEVVEPEDDGFSALAVGAVVGLLGFVAAATWWFRDRLAPYAAKLPYVGGGSSSAERRSSSGSGGVGRSYEYDEGSTGTETGFDESEIGGRERTDDPLEDEGDRSIDRDR